MSDTVGDCICTAIFSDIKLIKENYTNLKYKLGRSLDSEDVQNFLHAKERGIQVHLFVRKNKDDKISKEFYYLGRMYATGKTEIVSGDLHLKEHKAAKWLSKDELDSVAWLPADLELVETIKKFMKGIDSDIM